MDKILRNSHKKIDLISCSLFLVSIIELTFATIINVVQNTLGILIPQNVILIIALILPLLLISNKKLISMFNTIIHRIFNLLI